MTDHGISPKQGKEGVTNMEGLKDATRDPIKENRRGGGACKTEKKNQEAE